MGNDTIILLFRKSACCITNYSGDKLEEMCFSKGKVHFFFFFLKNQRNTMYKPCNWSGLLTSAISCHAPKQKQNKKAKSGNGDIAKKRCVG